MRDGLDKGLDEHADCRTNCFTISMYGRSEGTRLLKANMYIENER